MKKMYCLVVTDDYSRFTWVFFLATKDETSGILNSFITRIENLVDHKVKVIRSDNRTEFKNREMNQFCEIKGILRQFSIVRTPQQNGVAERTNRTLIKAARTMLADSKLLTTFWVEAVNTACYVQNRVCPVIIFNTIDHLGKFECKADEGFFIGYSLNSKAFIVFISITRILEEHLHIRYSENTPNVVGSRPDWLFDIDALNRIMNYELIVVGTQSNDFVGVSTFNFSSDDEDAGEMADMNNLDTTIQIKVKTASTPMETQKPLLKDKDGNEVDVHMYRSMIGSLMYLTFLRPDIMFAVCASARYQVNPKVSHLHAMKRIFKYLKGQPKLGLWYPKDSPFDLVAYTDNDYAEASLDKKCTIGEVKTASTPMETQKPLLKDKDGNEVDVHMYRSMIGSLMYLTFLRPDIMFAFWSTAKAKTINGEVQLHAKVDGKKIIMIESSVRRDLRLADEEGGGPRYQEAIGDTTAQTRPLKNEIASLKRMVKKPEKRIRSRTYKLKRLYKVSLTARVESSDEESLVEDASKQGRRIDVIDADKGITLVKVQDDAKMFDVNDLSGEEVFVLKQEVVSTIAATITIEELTLSQALEALKNSKPKVKGIVIHEQEEPGKSTLTTTISKQQSQDKGKEIMIKEPDNIMEKIDVDHQLAERMKTQEQKELSDAEKATLFQQLFEKRRKHFAAKRAEEKRNKPPTQAQKKKIMRNYLKNMEGYKLKQLNLKEFDEI
nr:putative ribonuclease H-like domain-containing protein [Tanacetum cinerariifolium]